MNFSQRFVSRYYHSIFNLAYNRSKAVSLNKILEQEILACSQRKEEEIDRNIVSEYGLDQD
jgi:hypothetical protein